MQEFFSLFSLKFMRIKNEFTKDSNPINNEKEKTLVLCTHRSWADFFNHDAISGFKCNFLSRYKNN